MKTRKLVHIAIIGSVIALLAIGNISFVFGGGWFGNVSQIAIGGVQTAGWNGGVALYAISNNSGSIQLWEWVNGSWTQHWMIGAPGTPIYVAVDQSGDPVILTNNNGVIAMYWATSIDPRAPWLCALSNTNGGRELLMGGPQCNSPYPIWMATGTLSNGNIQYLWNLQNGVWQHLFTGGDNRYQHAVDGCNNIWEIVTAGQTQILTNDAAWGAVLPQLPPPSSGFYSIPFDNASGGNNQHCCYLSEHGGAQKIASSQNHPLYSGGSTTFVTDAWGTVFLNEYPQYYGRFGGAWYALATNPKGTNQPYLSIAVDANNRPYVVTQDGLIWQLISNGNYFPQDVTISPSTWYQMN